MSSYLERIASGVMDGRRAIHPSVGSFWMPQRNAAALEESPEAVAPIVPPRSAAPSLQHDAQSPRDVQSRANVEEHVEEHSVALLQHLSESAPDAVSYAVPRQALVKRPAAISSADAAISRHPAEQREPKSATSSTILRAEAPQTEGWKAVDAVTRPTFTPLVATESHESLPQPRGAAASLARERSMRAQVPAPSPAPQHDEIEIHIGRIEIAAVLPQQAPRLPARPAHKPLELGEYLKRDRRNR